MTFWPIATILMKKGRSFRHIKSVQYEFGYLNETVKYACKWFI